MNRRKIYYPRQHPNVRSRRHRKAGNYPALRTFKGKLDPDVPELVQRFNFYLGLSGLWDEYVESGGKEKDFHHHLERLGRSKLSTTISNYTIDGIMLANNYGPRHNPSPRSKKDLIIFTNYFESLARKIGTWRPFKFKYHKSEFESDE